MNNNPIQCVGVDQKIHFCFVDSNTTLCGITVTRKKLLKNDILSSFNNGHCIECDYKNDDIIEKNIEKSVDNL